jgi:hypothetical protein
MKRVQLPDGSIGEFPDDMADGDIERVLQEQFRPESDAAAKFRDFASDATENPGRAVDVAQYEALPAWKKPLVAAADAIDLTANGLTGGWGNKAAAYARSIGTGNSYEDELSRMQNYTQSARNRAGLAGDVAEMAGGLKTALVLGGKGLTMAGGLGSAGMTGAKGLALRSLLMGGEGAAYGAVTGAGNAAYGDELSGAGTGALYGGVAGALGNVASEGVSKAIEKGSQAWHLFRADPETRAAAAVFKAAQEAGVDPATARQMLDEIGPDAMTVDILGKHGTGMARSAANISPEARETLEAALLGRKAGQNERIAGRTLELAGLPPGGRQTVDDLQRQLYDAQAPAIRSAYDDARLAGYDLPTDSFQDILTSPMGEKAYREALPAIRNFDVINPPRVPARAVPAPQTDIEDAVAKLRWRAAGQERRAVKALAPSAGAKPAKPMRLSEFVAANGGILDFKGEAAAVAGGVKNRFGKLVRDNATKSLDYMREAAEEAGYLHGYTNDEYGRATVDDFLRALNDDVRGTPIYAQEAGSDVANLDAWEAANEMRNSVRTSADRIGQELSGSVSDDVFQRAVRHAEDGLDPEVALERAISDDLFENGIAPSEVPAGMFDDPMNPGAKPKDYSELARLDMTKRLLDSRGNVAFRAGDNAEATAASGMAKVLRERIDKAMSGPEYATARGLRQKAFQTENAVNLGADLARGRVPANLPSQARGVGADHLVPLRQGYALQQAENLLNRNSTEGALNKLSTPLGREAYEAALGDQAPGLAKALAAEKRFNTSAREVTGNSTTARQIAEMLGFGGGGMATAALFGLDTTTGGLTGAALSLARRGAPALQRHLATKSQRAMAPYIADLLTGKALPQARQLPRGVGKRVSESKRDALARLLMGLGIHQAVSSQRER